MITQSIIAAAEILKKKLKSDFDLEAFLRDLEITVSDFSSEAYNLSEKLR